MRSPRETTKEPKDVSRFCIAVFYSLHLCTGVITGTESALIDRVT